MYNKILIALIQIVSEVNCFIEDSWLQERDVSREMKSKLGYNYFLFWGFWGILEVLQFLNKGVLGLEFGRKAMRDQETFLSSFWRVSILFLFRGRVYLGERVWFWEGFMESSRRFNRWCFGGILDYIRFLDVKSSMDLRFEVS